MDRTEILYFLHQKRRQTVLQPAIQLLNNSLKTDPLNYRYGVRSQ